MLFHTYKYIGLIVHRTLLVVTLGFNRDNFGIQLALVIGKLNTSNRSNKPTKYLFI